MTRALILANRPPLPLEDGWRVRAAHVVRGVAAVHDTTLLMFAEPGDPGIAASEAELGVRVVAVPPPRSYTPDRLLLGLLSRTPVLAVKQRSRAYARALGAEVDRGPLDVAIAISTLMYPYLDALPPAVPRVVDVPNTDSVTLSQSLQAVREPLRRAYTAITIRKLRGFEGRTFADADRVWVASDDEAETARLRAPGARAVVVPNGVDTDAFAPQAADRAGTRMLFFGRLDYFPNVDALEHFATGILPLIRRARPDAELDIVGPAATARVEAIAAADPRIHLRGRVDDIRAALAAAAVVVVPLRAGGGTRLKVVEALSMARPTVATTIGAEGLHLTPGEDLLIADDPEAFAAATVRLLEDPETGARLGARARETVRAGYDWSASRAVIAESLSGLVPRR